MGGTGSWKTEEEQQVSSDAKKPRRHHCSAFLGGWADLSAPVCAGSSAATVCATKIRTVASLLVPLLLRVLGVSTPCTRSARPLGDVPLPTSCSCSTQTHT